MCLRRATRESKFAELSLQWGQSAQLHAASGLVSLDAQTIYNGHHAQSMPTHKIGVGIMVSLLQHRCAQSRPDNGMDARHGSMRGAVCKRVLSKMLTPQPRLPLIGSMCAPYTSDCSASVLPISLRPSLPVGHAFDYGVRGSPLVYTCVRGLFTTPC